MCNANMTFDSRIHINKNPDKNLKHNKTNSIAFNQMYTIGKQQISQQIDS